MVAKVALLFPNVDITLNQTALPDMMLRCARVLSMALALAALVIIKNDARMRMKSASRHSNQH